MYIDIMTINSSVPCPRPATLKVGPTHPQRSILPVYAHQAIQLPVLQPTPRTRLQKLLLPAVLRKLSLALHRACAQPLINTT